MLAAIVEKTALYVYGLSCVLRDEGYDTVAVTGVHDLDRLETFDLIVTGLHTPGELVAFQTRLASCAAAPPCVALLSDALEPHMLGCASAGFSAVVHRTCGLATLRRAIRAAVEGRRFADEQVGSWLLSGLSERFDNAGLSEREREVAQLLASDMTRDEIARTLFVSPNTIKYHTANVYTKLGIQTRRGLRHTLGEPVTPPRRHEGD